MRFTPWRTVRGRLVLAALLVELVMLAILVGNSLRLLHEAMGEQAREQAEQIAPVLSAALVAPLAQYDYATVQAILNESQAIRGIDYLAVTDSAGTIVATSGWPSGKPLPPVDARFSLDDNPPRYDLALPIKLAGQSLGTLQFGLDLKRILIARKNLLTQGVLIAISELLLSAGLLTLLGLLITRQLSLLTAASLNVAQGQLTPAPVPEGLDDVGRLGAAFNVMSRAIAERVEQLTRANEETARIAASLQDRTEQLNAIFDLSPDGFVSFDAQSHVKYANPAFFRMTGLESTEIIGLDEVIFSARLAKGCLDPGAFPNLAELKSELAASNPLDRGESSLPAMKRQRQLIELAGPGNHVLELGLRLSTAETVSQILYFREVTHETEVDRMKSEFLSHAAHELRTPMASIFGYAEMMMAQRFSEDEQEEFLGIIHRQCGLMIAIINELLDLARIDDRRGKDFKFSSIDASQLVREVIADFGVPAAQQAVVLDTPAQACWVRADASKLMQAVRNILSNAYKYSPGGGVVSISVINADSDSQVSVGIRVTDHGLGMTSEQAARICERFYRVDTSGNIPGTGLGMSIVKEIMELHGGQVEIHSQFGAGTSVTLWLTAASAPV
ncbi:MAG: ATP-binding protein [Burkholderiales bacterium]|nr:ATP-binding protein [Burkholderiales bacterium]